MRSNPAHAQEGRIPLGRISLHHWPTSSDLHRLTYDAQEKEFKDHFARHRDDILFHFGHPHGAREHGRSTSKRISEL